MDARAGVNALSGREHEVLSLMADGLTNEAIARRCYLSVKSVESVVRALFIKLGLLESRDENRRVRAVRIFLEQAGEAHPVPMPVSRLVGREHELRALNELAARHRLLTVTGPGGVGKTRLVVTFAWDVMDRGTCCRFVDLSGTVGDVVGATADAFGVGLSTVSSARRSLQRALRDAGACLVVLDNAEHVANEVRELLPVLLDVATTRVVVTSRRRLDVPGEVVWRLPPLRADEACELLAQRITDATGGINVPDLDDMAAWNGRLEGLPLAIELFAARVASRPAHELTSQLDALPTLLRGLGRGRHRSVQAVLESSSAMLSASAQSAFWAVSVCVGGCTLDAARRIVSDPSAVADALDELVDSSLVEYSAGRYRLLEPIRQYAAGELDDRGRRDVVEAAFVTWGVRFCQRAFAAQAGDATQWRARVHDESGNIEAAVRIACGHQNMAAVAEMVRGLLPYWTSDRPSSGVSSVSYAVAHLDETTTDIDRAWVMLVAGALVSESAGLDETREYLTQAIAGFAASGECLGEAMASLYLGDRTGDSILLDRAATLGHELGIPMIEAWALFFRASLISIPWEGWTVHAQRLERAAMIAGTVGSPSLDSAIANRRVLLMLIGNWTGETRFTNDEIDDALADALQQAEHDPGLRRASSVRSTVCLTRLLQGRDGLARAATMEHLAAVAVAEDAALISEAVLIAASLITRQGDTELGRSLCRLAAPTFRTFAHDMWLPFVLSTTATLIPDALIDGPPANLDELAHAAARARDGLVKSATTSV